MTNTKLTSALDALKKNGVRVYNQTTIPKCDAIPTGSLIFNQVMNGGFHTRRTTQLFSCRSGISG